MLSNYSFTYTYVLNNPLTFTDPSGYFKTPRMSEMRRAYGMAFSRALHREHSYQDPWLSNTSYESFSYDIGPVGNYYNETTGNYEYVWHDEGGYYSWIDTPYFGDDLVVIESQMGDNYYMSMQMDFGVQATKVYGPFAASFSSPNNDSNNGGYRYGSPESFGIWGESATGAVLREHFRNKGKISVLQGTKDYLRNLLKNVPANQIVYLNPQVFKYARWAQFAGLAGDLANTGLVIYNFTQEGLSDKNIGDALFGAVGFWPLYGDAIAFMYMVTPGMDRMLKEDPSYFINANQNLNLFKCFIGGSQVTMADGTFKTIESVQHGDFVLTYNFENQELEKNLVLHIDAPVHHRLVKVVFSNGEDIVSTEDHPYYVKGKGWCSFNPQQTQKNYNIQTDLLEVSDYCFTVKRNKLKKVKVLQIESLEKTVQTYNLTRIENSDNYFVNGILVNTESNTENKKQ